MGPDRRFSRCESCGQEYWPGSHVDAMRGAAGLRLTAGGALVRDEQLTRPRHPRTAQIRPRLPTHG